MTDKKLNLAVWGAKPDVRHIPDHGWAIQVSLFVDKPHARVFAVTILAIGLFARGSVIERPEKKKAAGASPIPVSHPHPTVPAVQSVGAFNYPLLCAVRGLGRTLDFALKEAKDPAIDPLYVLLVREQAVITPNDARRKWEEDLEAAGIFEYVRAKALGLTFIPCMQ